MNEIDFLEGTTIGSCASFPLTHLNNDGTDDCSDITYGLTKTPSVLRRVSSLSSFCDRAFSDESDEIFEQQQQGKRLLFNEPRIVTIDAQSMAEWNQLKDARVPFDEDYDLWSLENFESCNDVIESMVKIKIWPSGESIPTNLRATTQDSRYLSVPCLRKKRSDSTVSLVTKENPKVVTKPKLNLNFSHGAITKPPINLRYDAALQNLYHVVKSEHHIKSHTTPEFQKLLLSVTVEGSHALKLKENFSISKLTATAQYHPPLQLNVEVWQRTPRHKQSCNLVHKFPHLGYQISDDGLQIDFIDLNGDVIKGYQKWWLNLKFISRHKSLLESSSNEKTIKPKKRAVTLARKGVQRRGGIKEHHGCYDKRRDAVELHRGEIKNQFDVKFKRHVINFLRTEFELLKCIV